MEDPVLQSPTNPHFFQPLLPGYHSHLIIPVTFFSKHMKGKSENKTARLRSDASDRTWEVEIDHGRRLTGGWKEFVTAHDLRVGDVLVFRLDGDLVFHVTPLGPSCCEIEYTPAHDHEDKIASEIRPMKKRAKKNSRREEDFSTDHSCFVANVSVASMRDDKLYVPVGFVMSNRLRETNCKIVLLNEMGRSWNLTLYNDKSGTYLRHGWSSFCSANGIKEGRSTFKLVRKSGTPVIRLCHAVYKPCRAESSSSDSSCFVGSVTPSSLLKDALYLPRGFVRSNGLKEGYCGMVLKNEYGGTWDLVMSHHKSNNHTVIRQGWRSFCRANRIKARDPFGFKLDRTGEKPVLSLCSAETNRDTKPGECSKGNDVTSLSTDDSSGEESSETEESEEETSSDDIIVKKENEEESISLRECLNVEKWKYCSGASSSASQNRFVTLTVTPYSFKCNKLRIPLRFTRVNGINKAGKITMLGQDGVNWSVHLVKDSRWGRMRLGRDWRGFCEVHGVKIGESFVLELVWEEDASPVLKFCNKLKHDRQRIVDTGRTSVSFDDAKVTVDTGRR